MLSINDMVPGNKYLVGDSCGYDVVTMIKVPSEEGIKEYMGEVIPGQYALVEFEDGHVGLLFEAYEFSSGLYIEPR